MDILVISKLFILLMPLVVMIFMEIGHSKRSVGCRSDTHLQTILDQELIKNEMNLEPGEEGGVKRLNTLWPVMRYGFIIGITRFMIGKKVFKNCKSSEDK